MCAHRESTMVCRRCIPVCMLCNHVANDEVAARESVFAGVGVGLLVALSVVAVDVSMYFSLGDGADSGYRCLQVLGCWSRCQWRLLVW